MVLPNKCDFCHERTRFFLVGKVDHFELYECSKCGKNNKMSKSYNRSKIKKGNRY